MVFAIRLFAPSSMDGVAYTPVTFRANDFDYGNMRVNSNSFERISSVVLERVFDLVLLAG